MTICNSWGKGLGGRVWFLWLLWWFFCW